MCLACEMDDLWLLYLERQAHAAEKGAADASPATPLPAIAENKSEPVSSFICEEPSGE